VGGGRKPRIGSIQNTTTEHLTEMRQQAEKEGKLACTDGQRNVDRFEIHEQTDPEINTKE